MRDINDGVREGANTKGAMGAGKNQRIQAGKTVDRVIRVRGEGRRGRGSGVGMRRTTSYLQKFLTLRLGLCLLGIVRRHGRGRRAGRCGGR